MMSGCGYGFLTMTLLEAFLMTDVIMCENTL